MLIAPGAYKSEKARLLQGSGWRCRTDCQWVHLVLIRACGETQVFSRQEGWSIDVCEGLVLRGFLIAVMAQP